MWHFKEVFVNLTSVQFSMATFKFSFESKGEEGEI